jgi:hypothetical protein
VVFSKDEVDRFIAQAANSVEEDYGLFAHPTFYIFVTAAIL